MPKFNLQILPIRIAVSQLECLTSVPPFNELGEFWSITRTDEEISLVCDEKFVQPEWKSEVGWKMIKIVGPLEFSLIGVLESILQPLSDAKISIFTLSTFDTDYILVKEEKIEWAKAVLVAAGFKFK
jgi:uncharacterized protein